MTVGGLRGLGVPVAAVRREEDGWVLETDEADVRTGQVVVATGYSNEPHVPRWAASRSEMRLDARRIARAVGAERRRPAPSRARVAA
ncbi:MAG TPA: hypothetical protein VD931_03175 [Baekduia sp.]|nr:hypothetical protein [Baekduia sp.]